VYLGWANPVFLAYFAFNEINNLRVFNAAFSSILTAPTNISFVNNDFWIVEGPRGALAEVRHKNLY